MIMISQHINDGLAVIRVFRIQSTCLAIHHFVTN